MLDICRFHWSDPGTFKFGRVSPISQAVEGKTPWVIPKVNQYLEAALITTESEEMPGPEVANVGWPAIVKRLLEWVLSPAVKVPPTWTHHIFFLISVQMQKKNKNSAQWSQYAEAVRQKWGVRKNKRGSMRSGKWLTKETSRVKSLAQQTPIS